MKYKYGVAVVIFLGLVALNCMGCANYRYNKNYEYGGKIYDCLHVEKNKIEDPCFVSPSNWGFHKGYEGRRLEVAREAKKAKKAARLNAKPNK